MSFYYVFCPYTLITDYDYVVKNLKNVLGIPLLELHVPNSAGKNSFNVMQFNALVFERALRACLLNLLGVKTELLIIGPLTDEAYADLSVIDFKFKLVSLDPEHSFPSYIDRSRILELNIPQGIFDYQRPPVIPVELPPSSKRKWEDDENFIPSSKRPSRGFSELPPPGKYSSRDITERDLKTKTKIWSKDQIISSFAQIEYCINLGRTVKIYRIEGIWDGYEFVRPPSCLILDLRGSIYLGPKIEIVHLKSEQINKYLPSHINKVWISGQEAFLFDQRSKELIVAR